MTVRKPHPDAFLVCTDCEGRTLRQNYGLARPGSLFDQKVPVAS